MGLWRFFLAFLLICHVLLPLSVSAEEENKSANTTCPQNFHCGNLTNQLGFPFFNSSHPSNCGLFMLNCEAAPVPQITFDFLHGPWFSVVNISDPVIKLRYDDFEQLRSTGICNIFHYDDKHLRKTFPSFSYSILHNITLYGCTHNPGTSQRLTDDIFRGYQIYNKCDDDVIIYYQNPGHPAPGKLDVNGTIHAGCKNITLAMVWEDDYSNKTDLFELLTPEFDLEWHLSGNCSTCYSEGLECRVDWSLPGDLRCAHSRKGRKRNLAMKIGIGISAPAMMIILVLLFGWKKRYSLRCWTEMKGNLASVETMLKNQGFLAPKRYSCSDLKKMTNSFKDKLGQGGFGAVYKGALYDGSLVAVKVLNERNGNEEDFINEVASVGRTSHVNIVTLLGFCFQGSKRALVYEFMPNGSLEKFIYAENSLTERPLGWEVLFQIAVGVARGLEYLHQGCNTRILHFDIKPHNILLDKDLCPKISDFGLAKLCPNRASIISMLGARGTAGYIAPEVFSRTFGEVSHKSDVYSYGMVILEMVGGRKNVNLHVDHSSEIYFPHWIYNRLELNEEIGLQDIKNEAEHEKVRKMTIVGLWCIQIDPRRRPSIGRVVEMLEGSLHSLQIPPKPLLSSPARSEALDSTS